MVKIEDITEEGIDGLNAEGLIINDMIDAFGKDIVTEGESSIVSLFDNQHLYIGIFNEDHYKNNKPTFVLKNSDYFEQVKNFGELYEKRTGKELIIKTDYSKPVN